MVRCKLPMIYQHHLVSPLDDDPLNIVLHGAIHLPTIALPHLGSHRKLLAQTSPAERCDLRFGSKRTENLKSHEAQLTKKKLDLAWNRSKAHVVFIVRRTVQ